MKVVHGFDQLPRALHGAAYAVGNFDGLHLGHRAVIDQAKDIAQARGVPCGVITFEPHPRHYFSPNDPPFRLTPLSRKVAILEDWGVDCMVAVPFDAALANTSAESFVADGLVGGLRVGHLVVGHDFAFGHKRGGNTAFLTERATAFGFGVTIVEAHLAPSGALYSSRAIRELLQSGRPGDAAESLGRWWAIDGVVQHGDARGRDLGFPTANLALGAYLQPSLGIYAVRAAVDHGGESTWYDGAANLGLRPTFDGRTILLEVHLLDFSGDLYGKRMDVAMIEYLRPEERFADLDSLIVQMRTDCANARQILALPRYAAGRFHGTTPPHTRDEPLP
ncbi:MAG: bifunctional riboflavin kinase/FAD synthetase [Alphaproteobacteria bacterium]